MQTTPKIAYHLAELDIARTPDAPEHILPIVLAKDKTILDVGCGIGQSLIALDLDGSHTLVGIDIDLEALSYGAEHFPQIHYSHSNAETLPFSSAYFNLILSRVALPYTEIPVALQEMHRVLKPNGRIWITLHPAAMTWRQWLHSVKSLNVKDVIFRSYVLMNGYRFHLVGKLFRFPLKQRQCESFQTPRAMRMALREAGFTDILIQRDRHFLLTAVKISTDTQATTDADVDRVNVEPPEKDKPTAAKRVSDSELA